MIDGKECTSCGVIKPQADFGGDGGGRIKSACRVCSGAIRHMRGRLERGGCLSQIPFQPTAEAHRIWMRVDRAWSKAMAA